MLSKFWFRTDKFVYQNILSVVEILRIVCEFGEIILFRFFLVFWSVVVIILLLLLLLLFYYYWLLFK